MGTNILQTAAVNYKVSVVVLKRGDETETNGTTACGHQAIMSSLCWAMSTIKISTIHKFAQPVTRARDRQRWSSMRYFARARCPCYFARASLKLVSGRAQSVVVLFLILVDLYIYRAAVRVQFMCVQHAIIYAFMSYLNNENVQRDNFRQNLTCDENFRDELFSLMI